MTTAHHATPGPADRTEASSKSSDAEGRNDAELISKLRGFDECFML